jgi:hypothetical protein
MSSYNVYVCALRRVCLTHKLFRLSNTYSVTSMASLQFRHVCPKHLIILKVLKSPYLSKRVSFLMIQLNNHRNRVVISPSYSGGTDFKSWPWNRLLVRVFVVFLSLFNTIRGYHLKLHNVASFCFLSNSLFINDPNIRRCIVGGTNSVIK